MSGSSPTRSATSRSCPRLRRAPFSYAQARVWLSPLLHPCSESSPRRPITRVRRRERRRPRGAAHLLRRRRSREPRTLYHSGIPHLGRGRSIPLCCPTPTTERAQAPCTTPPCHHTRLSARRISATSPRSASTSTLCFASAYMSTVGFSTMVFGARKGTSRSFGRSSTGTRSSRDSRHLPRRRFEVV